jgi:glycosyltransferase involved in cell wall biosynthesis
MKEQPEDIVPQVRPDNSVRPALIASEHTVSEYSTFLEHLLVGLADEAIPVTLICPPQCEIDSVVSGSAEIIRYPGVNLPLMGRYNRGQLVEQLLKFKPTVLHCLCESQASLTRLLADQLGLPYVLMINSLRGAGTRLSISWQHCARIIVPAKSIADDIARAYPRLAEQMEQINIGTFVEEKTRCFSEPSHLTSVLTAHPLDDAADFEDLLSAVRHLAIAGYEFALVIMGQGRAERQLRKLLAALDLSQTVTIVPRLRPWRSVLAAADIFIQPRPNAAFNPLLLEAMSVGSAIAACRGGVDDLIIEDRTATVFDPSDELSIRGRLQQLFDRAEFARKLAKGAQSYLRANHSVSNMVSATVQAYHRAQQGSRPAGSQ